MTDIDLTPINEAAARALFAEDLADRCVRRLPETATAEDKEETHDYFLNYALSTWDRGTSNADEVIRYRKLALAVTHSMWKDVARQAWDACVDELAEDEDRDDRSVERLRAANPYAEVRP